jgi:hypothetical protein
MTGLDPHEITAIIEREERAAAAAKCDRAWRAHMALARNYRWRLDHATDVARHGARDPHEGDPREVGKTAGQVALT